MNVLQRKQELLDAVTYADLSTLESLLKAGGAVNAIYPNGKTLLIVAVELRRREIVEFLTRAGANLDQRDFHDRTPLMCATESALFTEEFLPIVKLLLDAGANVNAKNKQGRTALMYTAYSDSYEMTHALLDAGADVNVRDRIGRSALNYSVYQKGERCKDLLLAAGADNSPPKLESTGAGFWDRISGIFLMDEFTELKNCPGFDLASMPILYMFLAAVFAVHYFFAVNYFLEASAWLFIFGAAWLLWLGFPSIGLIFPLGLKILRMRSGKSGAAGPLELRAAPAVNSENDLEFVSLLMDLGSKELSSVHLTDSDRQSLQVKVSIFYNRIISVLLALSIFVLVIIFFTVSLFPIFVDWDESARIFFLSIPIGLALPIWLWMAFSAEVRLRLYRLRLVQTDRDRSAAEISTLLGANEYEQKELPTEFGLYLRAFMTTGKLYVKGWDLETMLAYSIGPTLPLLALGRPGEHLGSGRIQTTDDHWQEEIVRLMDTARLILIIPSHRGGTLWEISRLRELNYLEKTIFIMPPELKFEGGLYSADWQQTVTAALKIGMEFPQHISSGAFFRLSTNGEIEDYAPFVSDEFLEDLEVDPQMRDMVFVDY